MDRPIILFRFHKEFEICATRIDILSELNPGIPIYGLYGGPEEDLADARSVLGNMLSNIQMSPPQTSNWKWLHPDINLKHWYRSYGKDLDFDYLYDYEWDILTTAPLTEIYPSIDDRTIALCAVTKFSEAIEDSWYWTSTEQERPRFLAFMRYMQEKYGLGSLTYSSLGPGPLLSREFIQAYSGTEDNDLVLCEIAYPAYAQALGFTVVNNDLLEGFNRPDLKKFFNCEDMPIDFETVTAQLADPLGRRAFHPIKYQVTKQQLHIA